MKSIRCLLGSHKYIWNATMTEPQLNWQECKRCGKVEPKFKHHYERYQQRRKEP